MKLWQSPKWRRPPSCHQWLSDSYRVHQLCFRPGLSSASRWGRSWQRSPVPLAGLKGPTSKGEGNGRDWPTLCKFLDPPLSRDLFPGGILYRLVKFGPNPPIVRRSCGYYFWNPRWRVAPFWFCIMLYVTQHVLIDSTKLADQAFSVSNPSAWIPFHRHSPLFTNTVVLSDILNLIFLKVCFKFLTILSTILLLYLFSIFKLVSVHYLPHI